MVGETHEIVVTSCISSQTRALLLIILNDLRRANFRLVRVIPDIAQGTSLTQEVPALIQFDLEFLEPFTIGFGEFPLLVQLVFLCDKALNMVEDGLIVILHENLLHRGCDRNDSRFMLRPADTAVNRCSSRQDDLSVLSFLALFGRTSSARDTWPGGP